MTSRFDHDDVKKRVAELNLQSAGKIHRKQAGADDACELPASSALLSSSTLHLDWSRFETVFATGT